MRDLENACVCGLRRSHVSFKNRMRLFYFFVIEKAHALFRNHMCDWESACVIEKAHALYNKPHVEYLFHM